MGHWGRMKEGGVKDNSQVYSLDNWVGDDAINQIEKHRGGAILHNHVVLGSCKTSFFLSLTASIVRL